MRDIIIFLLVFGSIPYILIKPYFGVLMWSWIGYMNPHRLTWGIAYDFPFAQIIAIATLVGFAFCKDKNKFPLNSLAVVWLLFVFWITLTTVFALDPNYASDSWLKMILIVF